MTPSGIPTGNPVGRQRLNPRDVGPVGAWAEHAACRDSELATFFPPRGDHRTFRAAVAICQDCPVRQACLEYAITNRITFGVWGGLNADRRRQAAGKNRGRRPQPMPAHGASRYRRGCRCDECRYAHRNEQAGYRAVARAREIS